METHGRARAPAAGTVVNALATGIGSAFAIDGVETTASVTLDESGHVSGEIDGHPAGDTSLIERCVERVLERYAPEHGPTGGTVVTESDIPLAAGLKSSSAAANATVLATLAALELDDIDRLEATIVGVRAARDVGVTVTGALDDASASMLGGVTVTDNTADELLAHEIVEWDVLVWTPPEQSFSADADVERCRRLGVIADVATELALQGRYAASMTVNGFGFCAALAYPVDPLLDALTYTDGVSLSGTGPSYVAIGERPALEQIAKIWQTREGETWLTTTHSDGARTI